MRVAALTNRDDLVTQLNQKFNPLTLLIDQVQPSGDLNRITMDLARKAYPVIVFEEKYTGLFMKAVSDIATLRNSVGVRLTPDLREPEELDGGLITTGTLEKPRLLGLKIVNAVTEMNGIESHSGEIAIGNTAVSALDNYIRIGGIRYDVEAEEHDMMRAMMIWPKRPFLREQLIDSFTDSAGPAINDNFKRHLAQLRVLMLEAQSDLAIAGDHHRNYKLENNKA
jgi:hypothetical protein